MKINHFRIWATIVTTFILGLANVSAQILITTSFDMNHAYGTSDAAYGLDGTTWTMEFTIANGTYVEKFSNPAALLDSAQLTISGGSNHDGTYAITETDSEFMFFPNRGGSTQLWDSSFSGVNFDFDGINASNFFISGAAPASAPQVGDPISAASFDGVSNFSAVQFRVDSGPYYNASNFSMTAASAVPEPSTYATLLGAVVLISTASRRRRAKAQ